MEVDDGGVVANFLHGLLDNDEFAVDVVSELGEFFRNLDGVYAAEDSACRADFGSDNEFDRSEERRVGKECRL